MKNKSIIKLILCVLALSSLFIVAGCSSNEEEPPAVNPIEISISIDFPKAADIDDIEETTIKIEEGSSVLDALQIYCSISDVPLTVETNSNSVHGISNLDNGTMKDRTWRYKLNGELRDVAESKKELKDGDHVEWVFIK